MKKLKVVLAAFISVCVLLAAASCTEASAAPKLSAKKLTLTVGSAKTLSLSGTTKKVSFKVVSGKKVLKLTAKTKTSVKITALKKGSAKVKAVLGKKSYTCDVTVKAKSAAKNLTLTANGKSFTLKLNSSAAAKKLRSMLPLTLTMNELNGNEKYYYTDTEFPGTEKTFSTINSGDLMVFGGNCLVLFYDKIEGSPYEYISLGKLTSTKGLKAALGAGNVKIIIK